MSTSFVEGFVRDFDARLMQQHGEAMNSRVAQELVTIAIALGRLILNDHPGEKALPVDENNSLQEICRYYLRAAHSTRLSASKHVAEGYPVVGISELDEITSEIRFMMADLMDQKSVDPSPLPRVTGPDADSAPPSWFEEDHAKLLGPFR